MYLSNYAVCNISNMDFNDMGFDESEYETYHDQIFVIDSYDVLNIKLIDDEMINEQEEYSRACTA